jgi:hypothetical protein
LAGIAIEIAIVGRKEHPAELHGAMIASKRFGRQYRQSSVTKGEEPKANERQNHRHTAAGGDEQRQDRGRDGDPQAGASKTHAE